MLSRVHGVLNHIPVFDILRKRAISRIDFIGMTRFARPQHEDRKSRRLGIAKVNTLIRFCRFKTNPKSTTTGRLSYFPLTVPVRVLNVMRDPIHAATLSTKRFAFKSINQADRIAMVLAGTFLQVMP